MSGGKDELLMASTAILVKLIKPKESTSFCVPIWLSDSSSKCLLYPASFDQIDAAELVEYGCKA